MSKQPGSAKPIEVRRAVVRARAKGMKRDEIADLFGIGVATVGRILRLNRETGDVKPRPRGGGNPAKIKKDELPLLAALVAECPDATQAELCDKWLESHGVSISRAAMGRAMKRAGLTRKKSGFVHGKSSAKM